MSDNNEILVFPRRCVESHDRFVAWHEAAGVARCLEDCSTWISRASAEVSRDWVQAIPCALLRSHQCYCVLRRIKEARRDLRARLSLIVGGHVDRTPETSSIVSILVTTLRRELEEELGLKSTSDIQPVGLVIDSSSIVSSRHIAFVYELIVSEKITAQAPEEFSSRSRLTGHFLSPAELFRFREMLDPWSRVLFEDYIAPLHSIDVAKQRRLPLALEE